MKLEITRYDFDKFVLKKDDHNDWLLYSGKDKQSLSSLDAKVLVELIKERGNVVTQTRIKFLSKRTSAIKTIQFIRKALIDKPPRKLNYKFIEVVPAEEGYKWVYENVIYSGKASLLVLPIQPANTVLSPFLEQSLAGLIESEFYFDTSIANAMLVSSADYHCVLEGSFLHTDGEYHLILTLARNVHPKYKKSIESKNAKLSILIDETKTNVLQLLREMFQETQKYKKSDLTESDIVYKESFETTNEEAIEYYLKGEHFWSKRDQKSVRLGLSYFEKAVATAPKFSSALIGIAKSYVILCLVGSEILSPKFAIPKAVKALENLEDIRKRRLLQDKKFSDVKAISGLIAFVYDWNSQKAFDLFEESLKLDPINYKARTWYAQSLVRNQCFKEAIEEIERARSHSGYTLPVINTAYIQILYFARQYEESISKAKEILEMYPNLRLGHLFWGTSTREYGDIESAVLHLQKAFELLPNSATIGELGYTYALIGEANKAKEMHQHLNKIRSAGEYVSHYNDAKIYAGLNLIDECFKELEKAYEERSPWLAQLSVDPIFDKLKDLLPYKNIISKIRGFDR